MKIDLTDLKEAPIELSGQALELKDYFSYEVQDKFIILDAVIEENSSESRVRIELDANSLEVQNVTDYPALTGSYFSPNETSYFRILNSGNNATLEKYDSDLELLWRENLRFNLYDVHIDDDSFIYCAGSKRASDFYGENEAVVIKLNSEGALIAESEPVAVWQTPQFWPGSKLAYAKIIALENSLLLVGIEDYNTDFFSGLHHLLVGEYNFNLEKQLLIRHDKGGLNSTISSFDIKENKIYGVANATSHHLDYTYYFNITLPGPSNNESLFQESISYFPNPVTDELSLDIEIGSQISIHSLAGQLIKKESYDGVVELGHLPAGPYLISVGAGSNLTSFKIIKQ